MINRRFLRTTVMQTIYSLQIESAAVGEAVYETYKDHLITYAFKNDKPQSWIDDQLSHARGAIDLLGNSITAESSSFFPEESRAVLTSSLNIVLNRHQKDVERKQKELQADLDVIYDYYLKLLLLAAYLPDNVTREEHDNQRRHIKPALATEAQLRLTRNPYLIELAENKALAEAAKRRGISWDGDMEVIKDVYKNNLKTNETYQEYLAADKDDNAQHLRITKWMLRNFMLGSSTVNHYFEAASYNWMELKPAVSHLLHQSVKGWVNPDAEPLPLMTQTTDWMDDVHFQQELIKRTLADWDANVEEARQAIDNWEISRIAQVDLILICMAISEFRHFMNVPVKVTINEYLEIAKNYSTPQSQQFLNGVLDKISTDMQQRKLMRKSALGMMDK